MTLFHQIKRPSYREPSTRYSLTNLSIPIVHHTNSAPISSSIPPRYSTRSRARSPVSFFFSIYVPRRCLYLYPYRRATSAKVAPSPSSQLSFLPHRSRQLCTICAIVLSGSWKVGKYVRELGLLCGDIYRGFSSCACAQQVNRYTERNE